MYLHKSFENNYTSQNVESFKFLISIREEDWKKANISGADLTFSDVELSLNKNEAREIYKNLIEKKENIKFPSFEDAWIKFGEIDKSSYF